MSKKKHSRKRKHSNGSTEITSENERLKAELSFLKRQKWKNSITHLLEKLIQWAGTVLCFYFGANAAIHFAGLKTSTDVDLNLAAGGIQFKDVIYWITIGLVILYGYGQRRLRIKFIEKNSERTSKLEATIDEGRTSSGLTRQGETNPRELP